MGLLDLPPEVLDHIISFTVPSGIENFALTCKTVYLRAETQIKQHNSLKRKWKNAAHSAVSRRGDTLRILYEISCEPKIAEYIESLSLWDRRLEENIPNVSDLVDFRADHEVMQKIKEMVHPLEWLKNAGVEAEEWWERLVHDDQEENPNDEENNDKLYAVIALLSLLPNLKTLQLPQRWHEVRALESAEKLVPLVQSLVQWSNAGTGHYNPLAKLETLLPFMMEGYEEKAGLQCLQPFMLLSSIRTIYAVSCVAVDDGYTGIPFQWPHLDIHSPLTKLEFAYCCMDAEGISGLLSHTPALAIFKYSHQTKWHGCEHDWNPGAFIEALARHCGPNIVELCITIDELYGDIINGASSLLAFPNLERLEMDALAFCGPPVESGQQLGMNTMVPEGDTPWSTGDIPCLGDMLPDSVQEIQINTDFPEPEEGLLWALFKNIPDRRSSKLTKLDKVVIRQYKSDSARPVADHAGVILEVFGLDEGDTRPRSMMPAWKRAFEQLSGRIGFTS